MKKKTLKLQQWEIDILKKVLREGRDRYQQAVNLAVFKADYENQQPLLEVVMTLEKCLRQIGR